MSGRPHQVRAEQQHAAPSRSAEKQEPTTDKPEDGAASCPDCGGPLSHFGWCQRCGHSELIQKKQAADKVAELFKSGEEAKKEEPGEWLGVLACGLVIVALGSLMAGINLRDEARGQRLWCVTQAILGGASLVVGYVLGFLRVAPAGQRLHHLHKFLSPLLWQTLWQRLPSTVGPVCLVIWGVCSCAGALLIHLVNGK